jgi:hypothetical protein
MRFEVILTSNRSEADTAALYTALLQAPAAHQHARMKLVPRSRESDEMGIPLSTIEFITNSALQLASLIVAIAAWRTSRPHSPKVTIRREDGLEVTVSTADSESVERVIRALERSNDGTSSP